MGKRIHGSSLSGLSPFNIHVQYYGVFEIIVSNGRCPIHHRFWKL
jgi:hypothetical protein